MGKQIGEELEKKYTIIVKRRYKLVYLQSFALKGEIKGVSNLQFNENGGTPYSLHLLCGV